MSTHRLKVNTQLRIAKSARVVYEAIVDPAKMSGYFISAGSARLDQPERLRWRWADVNMELEITPVKTEKNRRVIFRWKASGTEAQVTITLVRQGAGTLIKVLESGWPQNLAGMKQCLGQMQGWANMLCCLKAYLEHGINLRRGAIVK